MSDVVVLVWAVHAAPTDGVVAIYGQVVDPPAKPIVWAKRLKWPASCLPGRFRRRC